MNIFERFKSLTPTDKIALLALVLSVFSFGFSIYANNKQSNLSIRPLLTSFVRYNSIDIANNGLGPAVIKKIVMTIDDDPKEIKTSEDIKMHLKKHMISDAYDFSAISPGATIKDGAFQNILTSKVNTPESLKRIKFNIDYNDMKGNGYKL